jgi:hypothetical protein
MTKLADEILSLILSFSGSTRGHDHPNLEAASAAFGTTYIQPREVRKCMSLTVV